MADLRFEYFEVQRIGMILDVELRSDRLLGQAPTICSISERSSKYVR